MKLVRSLLFYALLVFGITAIADWYRQPQEQALQLSLHSITGEPVNLHTSSAQVLYFWGSWCIYCRFTSGNIHQLAKNTPVISIALRSGNDQDVANYLQKNQWSFLTVNDPHGHISNHFGIKATPTIAIIKNGKIVYSTSGWTSSWGIKSRLWLARLD